MKTHWYVSNFPIVCLLNPLSVGPASPLKSSSADAPAGRTNPKETHTTRLKSPRSRQRQGRRREEHHRRFARHVSRLRVVCSCTPSHPVNLAFALAMRKPSSLGRRLRVGILDLDIFGPSVPTLMGLQHSDEPALTSGRPPSRFPSRSSHTSALKKTVPCCLSRIMDCQPCPWDTSCQSRPRTSQERTPRSYGEVSWSRKQCNNSCLTSTGERPSMAPV